jgi:hypothetical protein
MTSDWEDGEVRKMKGAQGDAENFDYVIKESSRQQKSGRILPAFILGPFSLAHKHQLNEFALSDSRMRHPR